MNSEEWIIARILIFCAIVVAVGVLAVIWIVRYFG